jgi:hypothetical protein
MNPRRIGVHANGAYWGAAGEQIDVRSGMSVPFALNYNSQQWFYHQDQAFHFGRDVGFGLNWRLLAGSIVPVWHGAWTIHSWVFTDSTGAEYRLNWHE